MAPSKSMTPQVVTLQVACNKTEIEEKSTPRATNVTQLALLILVLGCGFIVAANGMVLYARGELNFVVPRAFTDLTSTLRIPGSAFGSSIFTDELKDLHEPLHVALSSPKNSITTVVRHGLSGSTSARKKGLMSWGAVYEQAAPPEMLAKPHVIPPPVTTISPGVASHQSAVEGLAILAPPTALAAVEQFQSWFGVGQLSFGLPFDDLQGWCSFKQAFMIVFMGLTFVGFSLGVRAAVRPEKSSKKTMDIESNRASAEVYQDRAVLTEDDIMDAFDAFDRKRMGFIDRATVNHLLGHMALPGHLDAAAPFLGSVKILVYDDFRRLAQQPGPFADIVMERVTRLRKKHASTSRQAAAFDERCKLGLEVDAAQAAISAISRSPTTVPPCPDSVVCVPDGRRSWAELREDLAPKTITVQIVD